MTLNSHLDHFMQAFPHEALTFDDVSLIADYADFLPADADLTSRISRRVTLNTPLLSSAMDTVTESRMAIAMAMLGGIGIIHKNLSPERQAALVREVKNYLNGLISSPVTFQADQTLEDVRRTKEEKGYSFNGFPIVDDKEHLIGILTASDIKFSRNMKARIRDVMTTHLITAPRGTTLEQAFDIMVKNKIGKLPLVENGKLIGLYSYTDVRTLYHNIQPLYNRDADYRLRVGAAVGPADQERAAALAAQQVDVLVVDTAHGHTKGVIEMTRWIKKHYDHIDVVAGNIVTADAALALRDAGADGVKVGIGPGSICTTRVVTGVGVPQISAIYNVAKALEESIPVIADGGIRYSGDVTKALVAGANSVMMGSCLAGTEESPGEKLLYQGRQYVIYRGMGSLGAMQTNKGSRERYGLADTPESELVPQGIEGMVPFAGTVKQVLTQFSGGIRAAMGFAGCRTIDELRKRGKFVRITGAGSREGHAHDVTISKEAPNYRT
ncbi:MAG: IMP dehydrogenase [Kiritimatiellae bacterium]|nr:IMP dehydrogenase [Kiritimatiellia bacterium]MCO5067508.1 IMP dehydrogenase [Kiritimatiellia bacterium]